MSNNFPFYTTPQREIYIIECEQTGEKIEIPKIKDISVLEKQYVEENLEAFESSTMILGKLATKLMEKENLDSSKVFEIIFGEDQSEEAQKIREKYFTEIRNATAAMNEYATKRNFYCSIALIHYRLVAKQTPPQPIEETEKLVGSFSQSLIDLIGDFWQNEVRHWVPQKKEEMDKEDKVIAEV